MNMRFICSIIVLFGCTWVGILWGRTSHQRVKRLRMFQDALESIEAMMDMGWPLPQIYEHLSETDEAFGQIRQDGWHEALLQEQSLLDSDREWLAAFGEGLGKTGSDAQAVHIGLYRKRLENCLMDAEGARVRKTKLCRNLGLLAGLTAALLIW